MAARALDFDNPLAHVRAQEQAAAVRAAAITGQREAQRAAIAVKREEFVFADVVSADDIGKLPDNSVAESVSRLPGVATQRNLANGNATGVSVRGLSSELTLTQLNGNYIATAESNGDPTRSFNSPNWLCRISS